MNSNSSCSPDERIPYPELDPTHIMDKAFTDSKHVGSATCSICVLNKKNLLASNLGDSGFMVIREIGSSDSQVIDLNLSTIIEEEPSPKA